MKNIDWETIKQIVDELKAILVYCNAISRESNRGIIKLLVKDEIKNRTKKILESLNESKGDKNDRV